MVINTPLKNKNLIMVINNKIRLKIIYFFTDDLLNKIKNKKYRNY